MSYPSYDPVHGVRGYPAYPHYTPGATSAKYPHGLPQKSMSLNPVPFEVGTGLILFPGNLPEMRATARRRQMGFRGGSGGLRGRRSKGRRSYRKSRAARYRRSPRK